MGTSGIDLTGRWDGTFSYPDVPDAGPVTPFLATIADYDGALTGTTLEPDILGRGTAEATLIGQRIGRAIHFTKDYAGAGPEYGERVLYHGTLGEDGDTVTGEWRIRRWRGSFEMVRQPAVEAEERRRVAVEA